MEQVKNPKEFLKGVLLHDSQLPFEVDESILSLGMILKQHKLLLKGLYKAYRNLDNDYCYETFLGEKIEAQFDYNKEIVCIEANHQIYTLSCSELLILLSKIDMTFSPIYPVGTIVELDENMFPEGLEYLFDKNQPLGARVILTGRKIPLSPKFNQYLVDYEAYLWPIGQLLDQPPMLVSNMMIKKVISKGFSDEYEEDFAFNVLRASQIIENKSSSAFMTEEDSLAFAKYLEDTLSHQKGGL